MLRILAINGSLRTGSHNGALLRAAEALLPPGAELVDLTGLVHLPPYVEDHDVSPPPVTVAALRGALSSADAVLISTPEYNSSVPGQLKNALDWASRPFPDNALRAKPAAVIGASTGMFGAVWAQGELRKVLHTIGAHVVDRELPVPFAHERFDASGRLVDALVRQELSDLVGELVASARRAQPTREPPIALAS
jgi:chromate reductase, NAD(P)H dehydrogenase (quinone)